MKQIVLAVALIGAASGVMAQTSSEYKSPRECIQEHLIDHPNFEKYKECISAPSTQEVQDLLDRLRR